MAKFRYLGDDERYYIDLGLSVKPGDVVDLDEQPTDGRFEPVKSKPNSDGSAQ